MIQEIFVGPQITQLFEDRYFSMKAISAQSRAWKAFEDV